MITWNIDSALLHCQPIDFRKSINGLAAIVEQEMAASAMTGSVFAFCNKNKDKLKVLYWDKPTSPCDISASKEISLRGPTKK